MNFPANEHKFCIEGVHPQPEAPPGRTAAVFGILAIIGAAALIGLFWGFNWPSKWGGSPPLFSQSLVKGAAFFLFGITPVFAIMSHIVSDGRCRTWRLAPLVLGVGFILTVVARAFIDGAE